MKRHIIQVNELYQVKQEVTNGNYFYVNFVNNDIYQALIVKANDIRALEAYFAFEKPNTKIIGISMPRPDDIKPSLTITEIPEYDNLKNINIQDIYRQHYPQDKEGLFINDKTNLLDLADAIVKDIDVFSVISFRDSIVRERLFIELSHMLDVNYNVIYDTWLGIDADSKPKVLDNKTITEINEAYKCGDICALDRISSALKENHFEEDSTEMKLLDFCYRMNYLLIETETENYASGYNNEILEVYSKVKGDLFEKIMPREIANSIFDGSYETVNNNIEQDKEDYDI